jgi:hypothetical protein
VAANGSARRERLVAAMLGSRTVASAAKAARIGERTAFRILNEPGVREEIERRRAVAFEEGGALLKALFGEAVETLARLSRESKDDEIRCRAARAIVELGLRAEQVIVMQRRLDEQERRLAALEAVARPRRAA